MSFAQAIYSSAGIGAGMFFGCLIGFSIRKGKGKTEGLWKGSVLATALLAGMISWVVFAFMRFVIGS